MIEMDPLIIKLEIASLFFSCVLSAVSASLGSDLTFTTLVLDVSSTEESSFSFLIVTLVGRILIV